MPEKITILKESGETLSSNVVSVFMIPDTEKKYIITTENAVDPHGLTVLHVSEIGDGTLQKVATDDEWSSIKTIMRAIISGNVGSYQYLPAIENASAVGQYSRDISVSASASKQMMDNYEAGDKSGVSSGNAGGAQMNATEAETMTTDAVAPENPVTPSTIFPTGNPNNSSENELIPGIAEVSNNQIAGGNIGMDMNTQNPTISDMVTPTGMTPAMNSNMNMVSPLPTANSMNVNQANNNISVNSTLDNNANMGVLGVNMVNGVSETSTTEMAIPASNMMLEAPNMVPMSELGVQVVQPTQVVPTAQIAQGTQNTPEVNLTPSVTQVSLAEVNLDEIISSAQEMLMESVKNIVQTVHDKLNKELAAKEVELKNREAALAQKESSQMAPMMSNLGMTQPLSQINPGMTTQPLVNQGSSVMPTQPMNNPMMNNGMTQMGQNPNAYSPTVVSASNDVM